MAVWVYLCSRFVVTLSHRGKHVISDVPHLTASKKGFLATMGKLDTLYHCNVWRTIDWIT